MIVSKSHKVIDLELVYEPKEVELGMTAYESHVIKYLSKPISECPKDVIVFGRYDLWVNKLKYTRIVNNEMMLWCVNGNF